MRTSQSTVARYGVRVSQRPLALALAFGLGSAPLAGLAATISVTSVDDTGSAASCTVREAIVSMNTGSVSGTGCVNSGDVFGTNDTINFDSGTFPNGAANTITLADESANSLAIVAANLTIDASANGQVTIQRPSGATHAFAIMYDTAAAGGSLTLNHLTLSNGRVEASSCYSGITGGGGICVKRVNLNLTNSVLSGNASTDRGGGIWSGSGNVTLTNSTLSNNGSANKGGGIYFAGALAVNNSTLSGNGSYRGAGIYAAGSASVTLNNSTLSGNAAARSGAISTRYGNISLTSSTLSGNSASNRDGGIYTFTGNVTLTNSTVSGNSAVIQSGGIRSRYGIVTLFNSTISGNTSGNTSGGIYSSHRIAMNNSIVAGNNNGGGFNDINVPLADGSNNNIIGPGVDPKLAALADNGGPTQTMRPLAGSTAIDAGSCHDPATAPPDGFPTVDQRGISRPQGAQCDIGAVEVQDFVLSVSVTGSGIVSAGFSPAPLSGGINSCDVNAVVCTATYMEGPQITLNATPNSGWNLSSWGGDCASNGTVTMNADKTCTATFVLVYDVTASAPGGNGMITPATQQVDWGDTASFVVSPDVNYHVVSVTGDHCTVTQQGTSTTWNSDAITQACAVTATFAIDTNSVGGSLSGLAGGSVTLHLADGSAGGQTLPLSANGLFGFTTPVAYGQTYTVTIATQPNTTPQQTCVLTNGDPTPMPDSAVNNVLVSCSHATLALTVDDGRAYARYGKIVDYTVTLSNSGGAAANNVSVTVTLPQGLDGANSLCTTSNATCTTAGLGGLPATATVAAGGSATWIVSIPVPVGTTDSTAEIDVNASTATPVMDIDTLVLFRDSFEVANGGGVVSLTPYGTASEVFVLTPASGNAVADAYQSQIGNVRVQSVTLGNVTLVRPLAREGAQEHASAWVSAQLGATLALGSVSGTSDQRIVLLEGAVHSIALPIEQ